MCQLYCYPVDEDLEFVLHVAIVHPPVESVEDAACISSGPLEDTPLAITREDREPLITAMTSYSEDENVARIVRALLGALEEAGATGLTWNQIEVGRRLPEPSLLRLI